MFNLVHPLFLWGALLVSAPIIIHLLNRRRYKRVAWAAIDLLRVAENKNRRRVRMEHLIVLLLRCLAVALIVLMIARLLFDPRGLGRGALRGAPVERIVILDDSSSMDARPNTRPLFDDAKKALSGFAARLADERPGDTLTVILTSNPRSPWIRGHILTPKRADSLARSIATLRPCAIAAQMESALIAVGEIVDASEEKGNHALYIMTDLRQVDWMPPEGTRKDAGLYGELSGLSERLDELVLVDVESDLQRNVGITDIAPMEKNIIAGVPARFNIELRNFGRLHASGITLNFSPGDALAQSVSIRDLAPGESEIVECAATFSTPGSVVIQAEISSDQFAGDNLRTLSATVTRGVKVLMVDGEPRAEYSLSETFYARLALDPPSPFSSGFDVETVTEVEFNAIRLESYQLIMLCNVYRLSEERIQSLRDWVVDGGGLMIFPGDQLDSEAWNETMREIAPDLVLAKAVGMAGDAGGNSWQNLVVSAPGHPVLAECSGEQNLLLKRVKILRWWQFSQWEGATGTSVLISFSNGNPAVIEHSAGRGRVLLFAFAADAESSTWPGDPSYVVLLQEFAGYIARSDLTSRTVIAGQPLFLPVDPAVYEPAGTLTAPGRESAKILRAGIKDEIMAFDLSALDTAGDYKLSLKTIEGKKEIWHIAVNSPVTESQLRRMDRSGIYRLTGSTQLRVVSSSDFSPRASGSRAEMWRMLAVMLMAVLMIEQLLAWWFSKRRRD